MPIDVNSNPDANLLTFMDMVKAQFHPEVTTDEVGATVYPRQMYLANLVEQRKKELEQKRLLEQGPPR